MLRRVVGMPLIPNTCTLCGQGPTDNEGNQRECIFVEGVDVNWGDSVYICADCAELIADLMGRVTRGGFDDLQAKFDELKEKYETLLESHEAQENLLDKIREGNAAQKQVRASRRAA